jgi:hypothetical protein
MNVLIPAKFITDLAKDTDERKAQADVQVYARVISPGNAGDNHMIIQLLRPPNELSHQQLANPFSLMLMMYIDR